MKVSIGAKIFEGPWGGGNLFVKKPLNAFNPERPQSYL